MKGFDVLDYNVEENKFCIRHVDYKLIERDGKQYAEPVNESHSYYGAGVFHIGNGDNMLYLDNWQPLEEDPCPNCGVYGLVHTIRSGEYVCANCGRKCILIPIVKLEIINSEQKGK
jgi:hypothetical protein